MLRRFNVLHEFRRAGTGKIYVIASFSRVQITLLAVASPNMRASECAMGKMQTENAKLIQTAIRREIDRDEASRYDHRLHVLLLVAGGRSCAEVATWFGENASTVQRWVRRFRVNGLDGLHDGERPGRPRSLDPVQWRRLEADLRKTPRYFGFPARLWDGPTFTEHLRRCYGVDLGLRQCQRLFRQMASRPRRTRASNAQA